MRFVLQSLDLDGFAESLVEGDDRQEMLDLAKAAGSNVRIWDRLKQVEFDRGICGTCEQQPCQCAHLKNPGWLAQLEAEVEAITFKEAA